MTAFDFMLRRWNPLYAPEDGTGTGEGDAGEGGDVGTGEGDTKPADTGVGAILGNAKPGAGETPESGGEQKEGEGGEGEEKPDGEGEAEAPPEDGKYTFELPEGVELDEVMAETLSPVLAELGLSNAQANKLAAAYMEAGQAQAQAQVDQWKQTNEEWVAQAKSDKAINEMGWDRAVEMGNAALAQFDPEGDLTAALTGAAVNANHPALIRFMARAGAALAGDKTETGDSAGPGAPIEDRWYTKPKG